ncbi:MAG: hypothetical protein PHS04_15275 [Tissierellia bacterium]|nr:hypothetical protein [Tissierellia bacterium]
MNTKKEAPEGLNGSKRGQNISLSKCESKDRIKLSKRQKKVYDLLLTGKHSVTDITIALGYGDPRSYIRDIREKGITVNDEWVEKQDVRYKLYYITPQKTNIQDIQTVGEIIQSDFKNLFERNHYD